MLKGVYGTSRPFLSEELNGWTEPVPRSLHWVKQSDRTSHGQGHCERASELGWDGWATFLGGFCFLQAKWLLWNMMMSLYRIFFWPWVLLRCWAWMVCGGRRLRHCRRLLRQFATFLLPHTHSHTASYSKMLLLQTFIWHAMLAVCFLSVQHFNFIYALPARQTRREEMLPNELLRCAAEAMEAHGYLWNW